MKVKALENMVNITKDKIYHILKGSRIYYLYVLIITDLNNNLSTFINIQKVRKNRLNKILDEDYGTT